MNIDPKTFGIIVSATIGTVGALILTYGIVRAVRGNNKPDVKDVAE
ncbi:hypothetical protein fnug_347 [Pseudomonas phage fnug]|uniref:Uncharacterized protein n=2 Tax=Phikzvirus phiKZ TaxID=169683 RepID=A0A192Y5W7_9CAUD|nr:hypothetical protein KTN4_355 [Pseudomonas phage KTN4]QJB22990.1 hypothetical protein fnug_347 [Pseudomonas phage fnug]UXD83327.1 hypothetical protein NP274_00276 [Pseudomonas phage Koomba boorn-mokiny kep-wari Wadjak 1]